MTILSIVLIKTIRPICNTEVITIVLSIILESLTVLSIISNIPLVTLLLVVKASHKSFALTFNNDATKKDVMDKIYSRCLTLTRINEFFIFFSVYHDQRGRQSGSSFGD